MRDQTSARVIQSVMIATDLLSHIRESNGTTVSELADKTGRTPGTIHTHLSTLKQAGFVIQTKQQYKLGPQFLSYGEAVRNNSDLYQASKKQVNELAENNNECAHLIIEHNGKLFALYERFGSEAVGVEFHNRKREKPLDHLHCTAAGKAILAHYPKARTEQTIGTAEIPQVTPNTITDRDRLYAELDRIREQGFALADEEQMEGIRAVGAPIIEGENEVVGAIALSGPKARFQEELFHQELPEKVMEAANICEVNLQSTNLKGRYM